MEERRDNLNLTQNTWVIGCPLCLATVPPPPSKPADYSPELISEFLREFSQ
jgi:hypothetical protein